MDLYLIRHADAFGLGERGITIDEERGLSERGETEAAALGKALQQKGVVLDKLYTSPFVRARQTAEILLHTWEKPELILETCNALVPSGKPRKLSKFLLKAGGEKIGLVGHMPQLGDFAAWLLGNKKMQIDIAKAGVAMISCGEMPAKGLGVLQWLVTPDWY